MRSDGDDDRVDRWPAKGADRRPDRRRRGARDLPGGFATVRRSSSCRCSRSSGSSGASIMTAPRDDASLCHGCGWTWGCSLVVRAREVAYLKCRCRGVSRPARDVVVAPDCPPGPAPIALESRVICVPPNTSSTTAREWRSKIVVPLAYSLHKSVGVATLAATHPVASSRNFYPRQKSGCRRLLARVSRSDASRKFGHRTTTPGLVIAEHGRVSVIGPCIALAAVRNGRGDPASATARSSGWERYR